MKEKIKPHLYRMLSFLIPCCIMLAVFAVNGKYPFGDDALLESDAAAQYYPFLLLLRKTIRNGGSLFYTWRAGLGTNFWALIAYYCLNPWNLIAVILPEQLVQGFLSLSVCVRIGLAGLSTAVFMQTLARKQSPVIPAFASLYGLSLWFIWNYFQLIWLDAAALMPLLLAGTVKLVRDRHCGVFCGVLLLSLICNPYFSFITCMMTFCCWICLLIILKKPLRTLPREAGRFFGCALLSGGMAAVILLPLAFAVLQTGAASQSFPSLTELPYSFPALLGRLADMTYPIQHIGLPNLSCSMLGVLLFTGFLTEKRIPLRERLTVGGLLVFLLLSLWYPPLNYIWHGMHVPNGFIHRFAFLVPFVLLTAGWRFTSVLPEAGDIPFRRRLLQLAGMLAVSAGICLLAVYCDTTDIVLISVIFTALYGAMYLWYFRKPLNGKLISVFLLLTVCAEAYSTADLAVSNLPELYQASGLAAQPAQQKAAEAIRAEASGPPCRTAFTMGQGFNPELFYELPFGGTLYSSLIPGRLSETLSAFGMISGLDMNRYFYSPLPPVSALLTDIRYVIAPDGGAFPAPFYAQLGDTCAYRFQYDLPFGFCMPETDVSLSAESCAERQNALFRAVCGKENVCRILPADAVTAPGAVLTPEGNAVRCRTGSEPRTELTFCYTADADGWYIYDIMPDAALGDAIRSVAILADDITCSKEIILKDDTYTHGSRMYSAGQLRRGQQLRIVLALPADTEGSVTVQAARLDEAVFAEGMQKVSAAAMQEVLVQDTEISGSITVPADRTMLYLPVPYDRGWHAETDGVRAAVTEAMPGMLGVRLTPGTHTVRLKYVPQGFVPGCIVSILSILLCPLLLRRRRTAQKHPEEETCARSK